MSDEEKNIHVISGELIKKAKTQLVLNRPFISTILLNMDFKEARILPGAEDKPNPGFWTDGKTVGYNPEYVADSDLNGIISTLGNVSTRIALAHHLRRLGRDTDKWNEAGNNVANLILEEEGIKPSPDTPCEKQFKGLSTEQVFDKLKDRPKKPKPQNGQSGKGGQGGQTGQQQMIQVVDQVNESGEEMSEAEAREAERDLRELLNQAIQMEKSFGKEKGLIERFSEIIATKNDWRSELMDYVTPNPIKNDYNWRRPVMKFIPAGVYLPYMYGEELVDLVVAIDVSGSIGRDDLSLFAGVINDILTTFPCLRIHVVYCDTSIQKEAEYTIEDCPLTLESVGGGGTDFNPVFKWITKNDINPKALLYITDLYAGRVTHKPDYPVAWVLPKRYDRPNALSGVADFGRCIVIEE